MPDPPTTFAERTRRLWRASAFGPRWVRWCILAPFVMPGAWLVIACRYVVRRLARRERP